MAVNGLATHIAIVTRLLQRNVIRFHEASRRCRHGHENRKQIYNELSGQNTDVIMERFYIKKQFWSRSIRDRYMTKANKKFEGEK